MSVKENCYISEIFLKINFQENLITSEILQ